jgi:hypothetical protein
MAAQSSQHAPRTSKNTRKIDHKESLPSFDLCKTALWLRRDALAFLVPS